MKTRAGATLIEVLVAIFVMSIGLLALLTLFPIGALRMAQAIQNERCTQAAFIAAAYAKVQDIRTDKLPDPDNQWPTPDIDYYATIPPELKKAFPVDPAIGDPDGPSFPVFIDPVGYQSPSSPDSQKWVGGFLAKGWFLRRCFPRVVCNPNPPPMMGFWQPDTTKVRQWFYLLDDLFYDEEARVQLSSSGVVFRDYRYSWAYLCQRPAIRDTASTNCTVVVFHKRPLASSSELPEYVYKDTSYFDPAANLITIGYKAAFVPPTKPGDWILDVSHVKTLNGKFIPHAHFYRVAATYDIVAGGNTYLQCEVESAIKGFDAATVAPNAPAGVYNDLQKVQGFDNLYQGTIIVIEGVTEVFDKGLANAP